MKILGIDYGDSKVGLGLSTGTLAMPWKTLSRQGSKQDLIQELIDIIKSEQIEMIVVGWPIGLNGKQTKQTNEVADFVSQLRQSVNLPVVKADERYSTQLAKKQTSADDDAQAAANILQSYLDQQK